ncbi:aquaporin-like protein [Meira miltonrushii]|uniref:Aquaporin-like protein n=1 Tax=Meira miltonrushii TaxID=1280837 RepID=A0A316VRG0_9BASI|nr:aquaporin-like protein [Meira miltonrushii]PWN38085.1 aquaporin-like protein [Meira miltonrushii]
MALYREELAEMAGAFMIILFGAGAQCQAQLYPETGSYIQCLIGWAAGVSIGAAIAGPISGGHINPAVTVTMAVFRKFSWKKVPRYILAQTIGCMLATFTVCFVYRDAIKAFEHASKGNSIIGNFISIPNASLSNLNVWFDEFVGTAILVGMIACLSDTNVHVGSNLSFHLFIIISAIAVAFGPQTGFAINPARDFGPRIALSLMGYEGVFFHDGAYWIWGIWLANIPGGLIGAFLADFFIYTGFDSPLYTILGRSTALPV